MKTVIEIEKSGSGRPSAWRNPNFRRLWLSSSVSWFGSEISELALPLLAVITLSASAAEVGLLRTAQFLPFLLATLPFGLLVDRRRRLPLMIGADVGRFLLIASIPILAWAHAAQMPLVYVIVFAAGLLTVLYQLADFAFLPRVVPTELLLDANGKLTATQSAAEVSGRGIGGLLVQAISAPFAVLLDAISYLVSAIGLRGLRIEEPGPDRSAPRRLMRREVAEGLRVVFGNRYVRPLLGEATTFNFFNELFILGLILFTVRDLGLGPAQLGLIFTIGGLGTFVGAWYGSRIAGRFGYGRALLATMLLGNTAPAAVVFVDRPGLLVLPALGAVFFLIGFGTGIANVHAVAVLNSSGKAAGAFGEASGRFVGVVGGRVGGWVVLVVG